MKTFLSVLILSTLGLGSGAALAGDDCGKKDRVTLPACATWTRHNDDDGNRVHRATNDCSETITVKFDISGGGKDKRFDIEPGNHEDVTPGAGTGVRAVQCCPRYNRCDYGN